MSNIQVPPDSTGKKVDTVTLTDAGSEVHRQKLVITGASGTAEVVAVINTVPTGLEMGLGVRQIGTADVAIAGHVTLSGTATVAGVVNVSNTASVVIANFADASGNNRNVVDSVNTALRVNVVAGAAAGPSTTDNTTFSTGATNLAGAGFIFFSASATTVTDGRMAAGRITDSRAQHVNLRNNAGTELGTSTTPLSVKIENQSATVSVQGNVNISATAIVAGTLLLSGSVVVAGNVNLFTSAAVPSASRGPRCVLASTSSNVTLVAAPGANQSIFVTHIAVSNASGANTRARIGTSASIGQVTMMMAQSAGGFVMHFTPPWEVSTNEALVCSVKPNASEGIFNVHYFVGSADAF